MEERSEKVEERLLRIYLNDHLAGSVGVRELAGRCRSNNPEGALRVFLDRLQQEIEEEQKAIRELLSRIGGSEDAAKKTAAWLLEKAGRLKLNGRLIGYSDLSRLEELEAMVVGIRGKLALWSTLRTLAETDGRLQGVDFGRLTQWARRQHDEAEGFRTEAVRRAFLHAPQGKGPTSVH